MTAQQAQAVQLSWEYIIMNVDDAGLLFYDRLFQSNPELKPLFKGNMEEQAQKLVDLITFAVSKLNNLGEIVDDVKALGKRHKGYNVTPEHYNMVAVVLLWTLEQGLGNQWTEELKEAWVQVYTTLASVMIGAAQEA
jgi:hemoglobin-like flavoprotein